MTELASHRWAEPLPPEEGMTRRPPAGQAAPAGGRRPPRRAAPPRRGRRRAADVRRGRAAVRPLADRPGAGGPRPRRDRPTAAPRRRRERRSRRRASTRRCSASGRLQPLLDDPEVENIDINGCDRVFVGYADGREELAEPVAETDEELIELIQVLAAYVGLTTRPVRLRQPAARPAAARRLPAVGGDGRDRAARAVDPPRPARQGQPRRPGRQRHDDHRGRAASCGPRCGPARTS